MLLLIQILVFHAFPIHTYSPFLTYLMMTPFERKGKNLQINSSHQTMYPVLHLFLFQSVFSIERTHHVCDALFRVFFDNWHKADISRWLCVHCVQFIFILSYTITKLFFFRYFIFTPSNVSIKIFEWVLVHSNFIIIDFIAAEKVLEHWCFH